MPRVVSDQKAKFESDELFRQLNRENDVIYTEFRDRPLNERQALFQTGCREGHTEIAFTINGINLQLVFGIGNGHNLGECVFAAEHGKVYLTSHLIMNGVCVTWHGWIDLENLTGVGRLEYDQVRAAEEDALLRQQLKG